MQKSTCELYCVRFGVPHVYALSGTVLDVLFLGYFPKMACTKLDFATEKPNHPTKFR